MKIGDLCTVTCSSVGKVAIYTYDGTRASNWLTSEELFLVIDFVMSPRSVKSQWFKILSAKSGAVGWLYDSDKLQVVCNETR